MSVREFGIGHLGVPEDGLESWLAEREAAVPEPRLAATVMIVRDGEGGGDTAGLEVFVLRRVASMAFAASVYVFPGGGVDERDAQRTPWAGPPVSEWARRLDTSEVDAEKLVCAAVREVFEECGVLLAGPDEDSVVGDVSGPRWRRLRADLVERRRSLTEVLTDAGLVLRSDLLTYRAHWVTPSFEPRRYDTRFFAAALPQEQQPDDATTETDLVRWVRPGGLLAELHAGEAQLMPPTIVMLEELERASGVADYLAQRARTARVMPVLTVEDGVARLRGELAE